MTYALFRRVQGVSGYKYAVQEAVKKEGKFFVFSRFLFSFFFFKSKFEDFHNAKCKIDRGDVIPCYFLLLLAAEIII